MSEHMNAFFNKPLPSGLTMGIEHVKLKYMYAVYGLKPDSNKVERFLGYVPAAFFESFSEPSLWSVITVDLPNGKVTSGRLYGRAFFASASGMRASGDDIRRYMGDTPSADTQVDG